MGSSGWFEPGEWQRASSQLTGPRPRSSLPSHMEITKAVITAAGRHQRALPLQSLVDRDGESRTALGIIIEEAIAAGAEEIGIVIAPGDESVFRTAAGARADRLRFLVQSEPRGYGHAVLVAREFVRDAPFLLLLGDHLYVTGARQPCARQLVEIAGAQHCTVSAVQPTHESQLPYFGAVGGRRVAGQHALYEITDVLEKPTPTVAEQRLIVPGLRAGHYLCFFGMHVLLPSVFEHLAPLAAQPGRLDLAPALEQLARRERYLAFETRGRRFDIGARYGLLHAQLALALEGDDRDAVLALILELLASRQLSQPAPPPPR